MEDLVEENRGAGHGSCGGSFSSFRSYGRALRQTPGRVWRRACAVSTVTDEMTEVRILKQYPD
jgi:hypothetical protein